VTTRLAIPRRVAGLFAPSRRLAAPLVRPGGTRPDASHAAPGPDAPSGSPNRRSGRLTRRGVGVAVAGAVLLAGGVTGRVPGLTLLGVAALAAAGAALLVTARPLTIDVERAVRPERVERGRPALARLRVSNPGPARRGAFTAVDALGAATRAVEVRALPPGADVTYHYELPTTRRGRYTVGPLTLVRADPFELAGQRVAAGAIATLWVHPRQLAARVPDSGQPRHHHETTVTDRILRGSAELRDVREYVPGDEVRHLHWKATARTGRLMVRDLADPRRGRLTVLLDDRPDGWPDAAAEAAFEEAVDVTAALLGAAARAGMSARLVTPGGYDRTVHRSSIVDMLDLLCELHRAGPAGGALVPPKLSDGGALVAVTRGGADLGPLERLRARYATVTVIELGPGDEPAGAPPAGVVRVRAGDAEHAVRQWNELRP
jgi:uncharacterized protein (DUF58 family)